MSKSLRCHACRSCAALHVLVKSEITLVANDHGDRRDGELAPWGDGKQVLARVIGALRARVDDGSREAQATCRKRCHTEDMHHPPVYIYRASEPRI